MSRIRFLGTSAGRVDLNRQNSSTLIEGPRGGFLLDAGEACVRRLKEKDQWSQEVMTLLLTHQHPDHCAGVPMLLSDMKHTQRSRPLEIYGPKGLIDAVRNWCRALRLGRDHLPFQVNYRQLDPAPFASAAGLRGEAWLNDHLQPQPDGSFGSFSLKLELEGRWWLFSGDLGSLAPLEHHLRGVTGLVVEARHIDPADAVELARKNGVEQVVLTHVPEGLERRDTHNALWAHDNLLLETREL